MRALLGRVVLIVVYVKPCVSCKSEICHFPQSRGAPALEPNALGSLLPDALPQAGETDVGLRTLTLAGEPLQYGHFPVCRSPAQQLWDLIRLGKYPSSCALIVASS